MGICSASKQNIPSQNTENKVKQQEQVNELKECFLIHIVNPGRLKLWEDYFKNSKIMNKEGLLLAFNNNRISGIGRRCNEAEFVILQEMYQQFNNKPLSLNWNLKDAETISDQESIKYNIKNILVVGITGQGKSTFINSFANYINGVVDIKSQIRYKVVQDKQNIRQGESVTRHVKQYLLQKDGFVYNLIDTPGLADTNGIKRDQEIIDEISNYLKDVLLKNNQKLHSVIIVSQQSTNYICNDKNYSLLQLAILNILKLFGKNMCLHTMQVITFSDFTQANLKNFQDNSSIFNVLYNEQEKILQQSMKLSTSPIQQIIQQENYLFQFQNSVFLLNEIEQIQGIQFKKNIENYSKLMKCIQNSDGFTLDQTKIVIEERQRLLQKINLLSDQLKNKVTILQILASNISKLQLYMNNQNEFKNYTQKEVKLVKEATECKKGLFYTNCLKCYVTCHNDCQSKNSLNDCTMMIKQPNDIFICAFCKCDVSEHQNQKVQINQITQITVITYDEIKAKYDSAIQTTEILTQEKLRNEEKQIKNDAEISNILEKMRESLNQLYSSALYQLDIKGVSLKNYIYRFFKEFDKLLDKFFPSDLDNTAQKLTQTNQLISTNLEKKNTLQKIQTNAFQEIQN